MNYFTSNTRSIFKEIEVCKKAINKIENDPELSLEEQLKQELVYCEALKYQCERLSKTMGDLIKVKKLILNNHE